jgi:ATP-binding cassette subfamily F protein 3
LDVGSGTDESGTFSRRAVSTEENASGQAPARKAQRRAEAEARQRSYARRKPLAERLARIEAELEALGAERATVESALATQEIYAGEQREALREALARQADLTWRLARLEAEWLEVSEALERLAAGGA